MGLKCSGNHPVINWIISQYPEELVFCNNLTPFQPPWHAAKYELHPKFDEGSSCLPAILYSYEDHPLFELFSDRFESRRKGFVGDSSHKQDILILRDPFNLFASRLLWKTPRGAWFREHAEYREQIVNQWKHHAREFLGETNYLQHDPVFINFNNWANDREYRVQLASQLGLEFSDAGFDEVPDYGGGSSVHGKQHQAGQQTKALTNRWKQVADHPVYKKIFEDSEIWELSEKIFGVIPETEQLLRSSSQISSSPKL